MNNSKNPLQKIDLLRKQINDAAELKDDWISGGKHIDKDAIGFARKFVDGLNNHEHWNVAPFVNGSLILTYNKHSSCLDTVCTINIAGLGVSAFVDSPKTGYNTIEFHYEDTSDALTKLLDFVNKNI